MGQMDFLSVQGKNRHGLRGRLPLESAKMGTGVGLDNLQLNNSLTQCHSQCYFQLSPGGNSPPPRIPNLPRKTPKIQKTIKNASNLPPPPSHICGPPKSTESRINTGHSNFRYFTFPRKNIRTFLKNLTLRPSGRQWGHVMAIMS